MHVVIAYAQGSADIRYAELAELRLPHLSRLLQKLELVRTDVAGPQSLSPPHERALAHALGWPVHDGKLPWAAWEWAHQGGVPAGEAWARLHPCHWCAGMDSLRLENPDKLELQLSESLTLLEAMRPYFFEHGITLHSNAQGHWYASGAVFDGLACASLDRVINQCVSLWMPASPRAATLRLLQNELQMLLHQHPINQARERHDLPTVNAFWISGCGCRPKTPAPAEEVQLVTDLRASSLQNNALAWKKAWVALDQRLLAELLARVQNREAVRLSLCGERVARTWATPASSWRHRLRHGWRMPVLSTVLESL